VKKELAAAQVTALALEERHPENFAPARELLEGAQGTGSSETSRTCWSATFRRIAVAA